MELMSKEPLLYTALKDTVYAPLFQNEQDGLEQEPNQKTEGIVVLAGHGIYDREQKPLTWNSPENQIRIFHGIKIYLEVARKKLGIQNPNHEELLQLIKGDRPFYLYLNGEFHEKGNSRNQLPDMFEILDETNFPPELVVAQNCVIDGKFNTLTQFKAINDDPVLGTAHHITLVTSDYHAPRAAGTAELNLNPNIQFDIAPAPQFVHEENIWKTLTQVGGELNRMIDYSSKMPPDVAITFTRGSIL